VLCVSVAHPRPLKSPRKKTAEAMRMPRVKKGVISLPLRHFRANAIARPFRGIFPWCDPRFFLVA